MASDEQSKQPQSETAKNGSSPAKSETGQGKQAMTQSPGSTAEVASIDAITLLKNDHRAVEKLFAEYAKASNRSRKLAIIQQVATMLKIHSELEESIFYPAVRQQAEADDKLDEAQVEHDTLKILLFDLENGQSSEFRDAKVKVLAEYVKHHVQEEEAGDGILEQGRKGGLDLKELGQKMAELKEELEADPSQLRAEPVSLHQFGQPRQKEQGKMRQGYDNGNGRGSQDRDERGRFTESRGGYDDDRRSSRGRGYDDDDRRSSSRSGGGRDDGRGGWFGDPRGHSEAARRGWDDREGSGSSRSSGDYDDDRRSGGGRRGGQGSGWYGDPQGHSEAARRGWEHREDDRGGRAGGGGYDDRSSRQGSSREYDDRGGSRARMNDDDDRRYGSSRSRSGDEGRSGGRSQGGWFGDPRGHSEAARRGWDERR